MNIQNYIEKAHQIATEHGFHDEKRSNEHWLMLVITEICEFIDAHRKGETGNAGKESFLNREQAHPDFNERYDAYIKHSMAEELADTCIRIFDFMGEINMTENDLLGCTITNDKAPRLYGNFSVTEQAFELIDCITSCWSLIISCYMTLEYCKYWADKFGIDLEWHIETKMQYNVNRPRLHSKQY